MSADKVMIVPGIVAEGDGNTRLLVALNSFLVALALVVALDLFPPVIVKQNSLAIQFNSSSNKVPTSFVSKGLPQEESRTGRNVNEGVLIA